MLYLATVSFSGQITMTKGKIAEISDPSLVSDLLKAGYIIPYEATDKEATDKEKPVPKTKRKGKA